jgi:class 3 adenylate cyclase
VKHLGNADLTRPRLRGSDTPAAAKMSVAALPAGTVTFVFSDIEGSTGLLKRLGEDYAKLIAEHRLLVRDTFGRHEGNRDRHAGRLVLLRVRPCARRRSAAIDLQRAHAEHDWPGGAGVRVRMGLHTGEPAVGEEGYLGVDVVRAARLSATATGGSVLLSETTRALLGSSLPEGVSVHPIGERCLMDIEEPERVFALSIDGVEVTQSPAPVVAESEDALERRVEALRGRMTASINERVLESLEQSLGKLGERC